ncbi:MAG TPA: aminotransferase class IV [Dysgonomonas sp.]|uniref:aminotransferase class IV n=1 Tax=unclassified Dysgonomonas TaxID=2630389 RepID=UPI0025C61CA0|nr:MULTISPECIES: aminotransferase class IV [unclassified Dysgonomonas]HML65445.1 aminotransferase class IV [Dysgonomonas sp.]
MKPSFSEVIKICNGKIFNLPAHIERMNFTLQSFFGSTIPFSLNDEHIPLEFREGLVKCRIVYSLENLEIEYSHYIFREINSLKIIHDNSIDYSFKYADRTAFEKLMAQKENCDDILIVKNGFVTDTSFTNVVFESDEGLFTPSTYLLPGTKRQTLLKERVIKEKVIRIEDIEDYRKLYLINAMMGIEDNISIPISSLKIDSL